MGAEDRKDEEDRHGPCQGLDQFDIVAFIARQGEIGEVGDRIGEPIVVAQGREETIDVASRTILPLIRSNKGVVIGAYVTINRTGLTGRVIIIPPW